MGYGVYVFSKSLLGKFGVILVLSLITLLFLYVAFGIDILQSVRNWKLGSSAAESEDLDGQLTNSKENDPSSLQEDESEFSVLRSEDSLFEKDKISQDTEDIGLKLDFDDKQVATEVPEPAIEEEPTLELKIEEKVESEENVEQKEHYGIDEPFDPRLDLRDYQFPKIEFLNCCPT